MASSRLISAALRAAPAVPPASPAPSPHGAQHETVVLARIARHLPARYAGLSRAVASEGFRRAFPGVPWAGEGNDRGRGSPIVDGYTADGAAAYGGHWLSLKSRVAEEGASLPSATFDVYGPGPNVGHALAGLARLHAEGKPLPCIGFFRTGGDFNAPFRTLAWAGDDLPSLYAAQVAKCAREGAPVIKGATFGLFGGIPEVPPAMPKVGRGGFPGVTLYVTQPDAQGYRTLRVSMKALTFDTASGEAGMARWLVSDGWPTRARKR